MSPVNKQTSPLTNSLCVEAFIEVVGAKYIYTDAADIAPFSNDWTQNYSGPALAVILPATTQEVSDIAIICAANDIAMVPQGGNTGLCGGGVPAGSKTSIILSLKRMNTIRNIDPIARTATVEAGVVLEALQNKTADFDLIFPLMFGARGSCTIGGNLATNAGGSNVVRYGNTRNLCLGLEGVLADGSIINALTGLRKDNTGYDIKDLLIGSEGTLGIITGAVLALHPAPKAYATAFLSVTSVKDACNILNTVQDAFGGNVEAFEYMPAPVIDAICATFPCVRPPLQEPAQTGILLEIASSRDDDAALLDDGSLAMEERLLETLSELMETGEIIDAMFATSEQQRRDLWHMRESVLESIIASGPSYHFDIALPLSRIQAFLDVMDTKAESTGFRTLTIGHLGDGNLHYALLAQEGRSWDELDLASVREFAFELLVKLNGSFSAEHGIGQSKKDVFHTYKEQSQQKMMLKIKTALDPNGIMNPEKLLTV